MLATDNGVYVSHVAQENQPRQVLALDHVTQVCTVESSALILVLANKVLYEYAMDIVNGGPEEAPHGREIRANVPFFHVGQIANNRTVVCVPSKRRESKIYVYEVASKEPVKLTRRRSLRNLFCPHPNELRLKRIKKIYVPCEVRAISLTPSKLLVTSTRNMIMIDLQTSDIQGKENG